MPNEFLEVKEVANQLKCCEAFVRKQARNKKISVCLIGRRLLFTQEAVDQYVREHTLSANINNVEENN